MSKYDKKDGIVKLKYREWSDEPRRYTPKRKKPKTKKAKHEHIWVDGICQKCGRDKWSWWREIKLYHNPKPPEKENEGLTPLNNADHEIPA